MKSIFRCITVRISNLSDFVVVWKLGMLLKEPKTSTLDKQLIFLGSSTCTRIRIGFKLSFLSALIF